MRQYLRRIWSYAMNLRIDWAVLGVLALGALPAFGSTITVNGTWYEFDFGVATSAAIGCGTAGTCTVTQNPIADRTNTSPWTFSGAANLFVLDLGDVGDRFEVFDNSISIGLTSNVTNGLGNPCGAPGVLDITCSAGNAEYSKRTYALGGGAHSITIDVVQNATGTTFGQAVFQANAPVTVPEPGSVTLLGAGLLGLACLRRRLA
jgi:PEP-CTERM motif